MLNVARVNFVTDYFGQNMLNVARVNFVTDYFGRPEHAKRNKRVNFVTDYFGPEHAKRS